MAASGGSTSSAVPSVRGARLREVAERAVNESLACCTAKDFAEGFPSLSGSHGEVLQHIYQQAQSQLRENTMVRRARWPEEQRTSSRFSDRHSCRPCRQPNLRTRCAVPGSRLCRRRLFCAHV